MEKVEIVLENGRLFVKWDDGSLSPILVDVPGTSHYGNLVVEVET